MKFDQFVSEVCKAVREKLGDRYHVEVQKVTKNNGSVKTGLCIGHHGEHIAPVIYLEPYYENCGENLDWDETINDILDVLHECSKPEIELADILSFEKVKDKVVFKLISMERNKELLEDVPHIKWMDMAIVFYLLLDRMESGQMTALIYNKHVDLWATTSEELYTLAQENMKCMLPLQIKSMRQVMIETIQDKLGYDLGEEVLSVIAEDKKPMYVLTNSIGIAGACCMMPGMGIEQLADKLGKDLVILPSSIHEIIAVPYESDLDLKNMSLMVQEVNKLEVAEEEQLSDKIYYFDRSAGSVLAVDDNGKILYDIKHY